MKRASRLLAAVTLVAAVAAGCAARSVRIAELKNELDRYEDKTVSITGVVTSSFGIPLFPFQIYNLDDGSGEIMVVSRSDRAPSKGARLQVKGKVSEFGTFGGRSLGLHIQETDRRFRG
jgi:hypothetical protein